VEGSVREMEGGGWSVERFGVSVGITWISARASTSSSAISCPRGLRVQGFFAGGLDA